ncbi:MAG: PHP domain-containing protein [Dethiobacter sp.]|nr:PHP domain-containing protein [Dethiobacter sp.]
MKNGDVAEMLERAARILALRGENRYRVRAYRRAARAIAAEYRDIEILFRQNKLQTLDGVGAGLAAKIKEILHTGQLSLVERLESGVLPEAGDSIILLASALTLCTELIPELEEIAGVSSVSPTGEVRRCRETVERIELVMAVNDMSHAREALARARRLHNQRFEGNLCLAVHSFGLPLSLYLVSEDDYVRTMWLTTGSEKHVSEVSALVRGNTGGNLVYQNGKKHAISSEADIYRLAGLPFIEPELREGRGESAAGLSGELPVLIEAGDYKGDLHVHTDWSDGMASIEKMAEAAVELGYEYMAVTDHSRSLKIAKGLSLDRLAEQVKLIRKVQEKFPTLTILTGIEADILDDGTVDAPDEVLAGLDVVIASIHSGFRQSSEKLTGRICRAMQNPHVMIVAHATGRLLGKRNAYAVDMDEVIRCAANTGTALEINSSPDRLDINDLMAGQARTAGVPVSINTDAHSRLELANVALGITVARRGWLGSGDVINTLGLDALHTFLKRKKAGA